MHELMIDSRLNARCRSVIVENNILKMRLIFFLFCIGQGEHAVWLVLLFNWNSSKIWRKQAVIMEGGFGQFCQAESVHRSREHENWQGFVRGKFILCGQHNLNNS